MDRTQAVRGRRSGPAHSRWPWRPAAVAAAAVGDTSAGGTGSPWILGTTDTVTALDPAGSYDLGLVHARVQPVPDPGDGAAQLDEDRGRRREVVHLRQPHDADLHAQPGREVLQRRPPDVRGREVQLRAGDQDPGRQRRRDLPARQHHRHRQGRHRHDEQGCDHDAGRPDRGLPPRPPGHHVPVRPHLPGCRGDRRPQTSSRPTRSWPTTRSSAPAPTSSASTSPASRRCSSSTRTTRARTRARRPRSSSSTTPSRRR